MSDQAVYVFRRDPVGDYRPRVVVFHIKMEAIFGAWPDKILDEIHSSARAHPTKIGIGVIGFDHDVVMEKNMAVESKVAKGTEPRRWIHQLISDDKCHRAFLSSSVAANFGTSVHNLTKIASTGAASFAFYPRVTLSCVFF